MAEACFASASFDAQAGEFDDRDAVPSRACRSIARYVVAMAPPRAGRRHGSERPLVLECGAGTGSIGVHFRRLGVRYVGFDLSGAMLNEFAKKSGPSDEAFQLVVCDGDQPWPIANGLAQVIFGSRAFHLFEREHLLEEVARVRAAPRSVFLLGRVEREACAMKTQMRRQMREVLAAEGLRPRLGESMGRTLLEDLTRVGGAVLPPVEVASWRVSTTPRDSLVAWRGKGGLAGRLPSRECKEQVLRSLERWAVERFGSLSASVESREGYIIEGVRFGAEWGKG